MHNIQIEINWKRKEKEKKKIYIERERDLGALKFEVEMNNEGESMQGVGGCVDLWALLCVIVNTE